MRQRQSFHAQVFLVAVIHVVIAEIQPLQHQRHLERIETRAQKRLRAELYILSRKKLRGMQECMFLLYVPI